MGIQLKKDANKKWLKHCVRDLLPSSVHVQICDKFWLAFEKKISVAFAFVSKFMKTLALIIKFPLNQLV